MYVSSAMYGMNSAVVCKDTGKILYRSDMAGIDEIEDEDDLDWGQCVEIPHKNDLDLGRNLVFEFVEEYLPDDFTHEVLYVFERTDGLVLFSGCSHSGILNIIDACMREFADTPIKAVLGGFHMMNPATNAISETPEYVRKVAEDLLLLPVEKTYSGHCTGLEAYDILKESMGDKIEYFPTGRVFDV